MAAAAAEDAASPLEAEPPVGPLVRRLAAPAALREADSPGGGAAARCPCGRATGAEVADVDTEDCEESCCGCGAASRTAGPRDSSRCRSEPSCGLREGDVL